MNSSIHHISVLDVMAESRGRHVAPTRWHSSELEGGAPSVAVHSSEAGRLSSERIAEQEVGGDALSSFMLGH
jgi:hypothetical protein